MLSPPPEAAPNRPRPTNFSHIARLGRHVIVTAAQNNSDTTTAFDQMRCYAVIGTTKNWD
jgi:hypothetical protein